MEAITLTYFNFTGRAELARLILAYAGANYTDERLTGEQFRELKSKLPNGQLPVLNYNGTIMAQSMTISRFLANKYNLAGRTNLEKAQADEIVDTIEDLFNSSVFPTMFGEEEEKKKKIATAIEKTEEGFKKLEARLDSRGGQFFAGNNLTWADLEIYFYIDFFNKKVLKGESDCASKFPLLKDLNLRVANQPNIKKWMEKSQ